MTALAADRNTPARENVDFSHPVAASSRIFAGSLVVLNAEGYAEPGTAATDKTAVGRAEEPADNSSGAAGAVQVRVRRGLFRWSNSTSDDEITRAEIGASAYVVDDQTVAKTDNSKARISAGTIRDVDDLGVWVET